MNQEWQVCAVVSSEYVCAVDSNLQKYKVLSSGDLGIHLHTLGHTFVKQQRIFVES